MRHLRGEREMWILRFKLQSKRLWLGCYMLGFGLQYFVGPSFLLYLLFLIGLIVFSLLFGISATRYYLSRFSGVAPYVGVLLSIMIAALLYLWPYILPLYTSEYSNSSMSSIQYHRIDFLLRSGFSIAGSVLVAASMIRHGRSERI